MSMNFYQAIKPMLITSKIFGMISFKFGEKGYKVSKLNIYIKVFICVTYLILFGYAIYKRNEVIATTLIIKTTDVMQLAATTVLVITAWLFSGRYQKRSIMILMKIINFDKEMRKLGVWISYNKLNQLIYKQIAIRFVLCIVSIGVQALPLSFTEHESVTTEILFETLFHFPILINTVICQEASIYITILKNRFEILNEHLTTLQNVKNNFLTDEIKIIKLKTFLGTKLKMLRVVCPLHHELSKLSEIINDRFGVVLLTSFLNTFVASVANLYFCSMFWDKTELPNTTLSLVGSLFNCATYVAETVYVCYTCNTTVEEVDVSKLNTKNQ